MKRRDRGAARWLRRPLFLALRRRGVGQPRTRKPAAAHALGAGAPSGRRRPPPPRRPTRRRRETATAADDGGDADARQRRGGKTNQDQDLHVRRHGRRGKLKTPQLLYFLNRVKLELDMSAPDKRSFMKELRKAPTTRASELSAQVIPWTSTPLTRRSRRRRPRPAPAAPHRAASGDGARDPAGRGVWRGRIVGYRLLGSGRKITIGLARARPSARRRLDGQAKLRAASSPRGGTFLLALDLHAARRDPAGRTLATAGRATIANREVTLVARRRRQAPSSPTTATCASRCGGSTRPSCIASPRIEDPMMFQTPSGRRLVGVLALLLPHLYRAPEKPLALTPSASRRSRRRVARDREEAADAPRGREGRRRRNKKKAR